jgi:hypothetical protein
MSPPKRVLKFDPTYQPVLRGKNKQQQLMS